MKTGVEGWLSAGFLLTLSLWPIICIIPSQLLELSWCDGIKILGCASENGSEPPAAVTVRLCCFSKLLTFFFSRKYSYRNSHFPTSVKLETWRFGGHTDAETKVPESKQHKVVVWHRFNHLLMNLFNVLKTDTNTFSFWELYKGKIFGKGSGRFHFAQVYYFFLINF